MAATLLNLAPDITTLAGFKAWGQAISTFIGTTAGWVQSSDTGQVNWSTLAALPAANALTVYEIWQPNDGLTTFYFKIEYMIAGGSQNLAGLRYSLGTSSNGSGSLSGFIIGPNQSIANANGATITTPPTLYPCRFSGAPGRLSMMLFDGWQASLYFSVERSLDATGTYTGTHVTLTHACYVFNSSSEQWMQQSILFGVGVAPQMAQANAQGAPAMRYWQVGNAGQTVAAIWGNKLWFDLIYPYVGYWDYQLTNMGGTFNGNRGLFTTTVYGQTRTYWATGGPGYSFTGVGPAQTANTYLVMRWD